MQSASKSESKQKQNLAKIAQHTDNDEPECLHCGHAATLRTNCSKTAYANDTA